ncbi:hypothetical protein [Magnetofaba australis]|uniref:Uncharacterized protein n=1 Tax=Magnetofaba australis IT-1 TaxID=1434232 RepID=A0A1Y2K6U8_9PROT|nr:hypothetical protein [Magnetofaba australis]OSM05273.1 hypothetical protein MAIT1_03441 [Magnetofaba australis IT-1]
MANTLNAYTSLYSALSLNSGVTPTLRGDYSTFGAKVKQSSPLSKVLDSAGYPSRQPDTINFLQGKAAIKADSLDDLLNGANMASNLDVADDAKVGEGSAIGIGTNRFGLANTAYLNALKLHPESDNALFSSFI